jgi:tRNA dimethylallyltransferase
MQKRMDEEGPDALLAEILEREPDVEIARNDRNRIIRYLELLQMGEEPGTLQRRRVPGTPLGNQLWSADTRHPTVLVGLVMDRDALNERIDARMAAIAEAAIDEVRAADAAGASPTARKAHGFEDLLRGDVDSMTLPARQFARGHITGLGKLPGVRLIDAPVRDPAEVATEVAQRLEQ